jgi:hypothetical protein
VKKSVLIHYERTKVKEMHLYDKN